MVRIHALGMGLVAALVANVATAQDRPTITVAVQDLPPTMEPTRETSNVGIRIMKNVYDKLVEYDYNNNMELVPGLASSWEVSEDFQTFTFQLREGVKFHNGDVLTAEDIAFTFGPERMMNEDAPAYGATRNYFGAVSSVEATGPLEVTFKTSEPDPYLLKKLGVWTGEVINKRSYLEAGDWDSWSQNPIGTGPYKVTEVKNNDIIVTEAFDDYWMGAPVIERIEWREVPEVSARIAGLTAGEYDVITDIPPDQLSTFENEADLAVEGGPIYNFRVILFNQNHDIMKDVHLRRALAKAIDRQLIVDTLWNGKTVVPVSHQWPEFGDMYLADFEPGYSYDPAEAKAELAQSGYKGEELLYPIVNNYYTNEVAVAEILIEMWRQIGINVKLEVKENWDQVGEANPMIRNWSNSMPFPDPSAGLWRLWQPAYTERQYWGPYTPDGWGDLGQTLVQSTDLAERKDAWREMLETWSWKDPGGTMLYQNGVFYGRRADFPWKAYQSQYMDFGPRNLTSLN